MQVPALVRTTVPMVVGAFLAFLAQYGVTVDSSGELALTTGLSAVLAAVYYALVHLLETRAGKWWGLLLGSTARPVYPSSHSSSATPATATPEAPEDRP